MAERKHKPKVKSKLAEKALGKKQAEKATAAGGPAADQKPAADTKQGLKAEKATEPALKAGPAKEGAAKKEKEKGPAPAFKDTGYDPWNVLKFAHLAEKSMNMVEMENKLIFIVNRNAKKSQIREAVEKGFGVRVLDVNVTITQKGLKKAYIKLHPDYLASDIATRLGML